MMKNDPFWLEGQQNARWPTNKGGYLQLEALQGPAPVISPCGVLLVFQL